MHTPSLVTSYHRLLNGHGNDALPLRLFRSFLAADNPFLKVMQESAQIALSWIRSHEHEICAQLGIGNGPISATSASAAAAAAVADASPASAVGRTRDQEGRGELLLPPDFFRETDLHVHVPAGAVSKDGPSAGVAIASAILSLLMGRAIDTAVAMTGEVR